eukprot:7155736-Pyramimonas_sp.AAC.1
MKADKAILQNMCMVAVGTRTQRPATGRRKGFEYCTARSAAMLKPSRSRGAATRSGATAFALCD